MFMKIYYIKNNPNGNTPVPDIRLLTEGHTARIIKQ